MTVIAWLWARTVASPDPSRGGAHVPLVRSFWLSTKSGKKAWIEPVLDRLHHDYTFRVRQGQGSPQMGTIGRNGGRCLLSESPMPLDYVRAEARAGRIGTRLMSIVAECAENRIYLPPCAVHEQLATLREPKNVPDTDMPDQALGFRVQNYGMVKHKNLFTRRQLTALTSFSDLAKEVRSKVLADSEGDGTIPTL